MNFDLETCIEALRRLTFSFILKSTYRNGLSFLSSFKDGCYIEAMCREILFIFKLLFFKLLIWNAVYG